VRLDFEPLFIQAHLFLLLSSFHFALNSLTLDETFKRKFEGSRNALDRFQCPMTSIEKPIEPLRLEATPSRQPHDIQL
tara:strand:- start:129 stop:362 length:234 start_codon:yes stop_codon:yes gene_type:complete